MQEKIIIVDFGSQFTQLIARRVRELNIYCEIYPFNNLPEITEDVKGVIFSGSPYSVRQDDAPQIDLSNYHTKYPLLAVCYGAQ
ncbi:MAG: GMP synthase (glutamine-hydrolyzing), partial [Pedobacter sp.]